MQKSTVLIAVVSLGLVATAAIWWQQPQVSVNDTTTANYSENTYRSNADKTKELADIAQLQTFRGATIDGALRTDLHGNLIIDIQLKRWIDFYLSAQGEISLEQVKELMVSQMRQLPSPGSEQALKLLDAYLGYLAALNDYDVEEARRVAEPGMSDLEARTYWQQRLRREWLEPEVIEAFFQEDEQIDLNTIKKFKLRNQGASQAELDALEEELPEEVRTMRKESRTILSYADNLQQLKSQGASPAEIQQWRVQQYGPEAAERLAKVDKEREQWESRLRNYQSLLKNTESLTETDREAQREEYRQKNFSNTEQKRLDAALQLLGTQ
ncbi:MAG: lipase secretion chaperone [Venatoribacter sp.]